MKLDRQTEEAQHFIQNLFPEIPECGIITEEINGNVVRKITPQENETVGLVDYTLNSLRFRSREFSEKSQILTLGCSITWGVGLPVEATWSKILESLSGKKVATVSLPGCGVESIIAAAFDIINKFDYKPEYIFALFPNFERIRYVSPTENADVCNQYASYGNKKYKFNKLNTSMSEILPVEYAFYKSLSYISILETFCKTLGIKFFWTTWSRQKKDLSTIFDSYFYDKTLDDFPEWGTGPEWTPDRNIRKSYFQYPGMDCHNEEYLKNEDYFYYAYDNRKPRFYDGIYRFGPHPGMHRNIHWAEQFYERMKGDII